MKFNFRRTLFRILLSLAVSAIFVHNASAKSKKPHAKKATSHSHKKADNKKSKVAKFTKKSHKKVLAKVTAPKASKKMSEKQRKELAWSQVVRARAIAKRNKAAEEKKAQGYSLTPSEKSIEDAMEVDTVQKVNLTSDDSSRDTASEQSDFTDFDENTDEFDGFEG